MPEPRTDERAPELEAFMAELRKLRTRAGEPSFRKMAAKSGAVSHATLHLTVTGKRLQPWETVREFVRACDGDEDEWHARWQGVQLVLATDREPDPAPRWRSKRVLVPLALALVLVAAIAAVVVILLPGGQDAAGPPHPGDSSKFIADVTIPDDTVVKPGTQFVKVWELQNTGTVEWRKRYLRRTDLPVAPGTCRTPDRIPVNDTAPQGRVQVTVTVSTPPTAPVDCKIFWKMVDEQDRELFPANKPIYFSVLVRP
ncbi:NBR1-Ig-like domain-containing protein [Amycolatopsis sp. WAC 01416]|uniref:NBR1-Ig-like domain-containing protein n=1 Tax=Amycolatopsis sp. WAC 01416 TaxID=2203196 RepID=UPI001EEC91CF|nr:NBR1-Ig-like domain-containing protein [Amycolatopsis sp. WAC 01416]